MLIITWNVEVEFLYGTQFYLRACNFMGPKYLFNLGMEVLDLVPLLGKTNCLVSCLSIKTWGFNQNHFKWWSVMTIEVRKHLPCLCKILPITLNNKKSLMEYQFLINVNFDIQKGLKCPVNSSGGFSKITLLALDSQAVLLRTWASDINVNFISGRMWQG